ncbi:MAG TPA: multidrug efflux RND transporter permease subunit [Polyangia bacterium]
MGGGRNFSAWFVNHPVATTLLILGVVLLGGFAFPRLGVAPLPEAEFPTLHINANFPGASPEVMASSVATPLEVQLSAVPGIAEMTSTSGFGSTGITLQFVLDKSIDTAAQEVQAALNNAARLLPADLPSPPSWRKVNPNDSPILILGVRSELMPLTQLSDIAETSLVRRLSQLSGVAEVFIVGQKKPAMRVQAAPERLAAFGLTLADIRQVVQEASVNQAKGALFGSNRISTIATNDQLFEERDYADLVVAYRNDAPVYLRDVAKVSFGAENDYVQAWPNGRPGVNVIIRRQPGANIIATTNGIVEALPSLRAQMPASVEVEVLSDRTRTIRSSLHEVEITLIITMALVVFVMGLFLRQTAATLIVAAVLVVALVATFAAMYALGFTLNNLTLVALIIAVGFVVDDAIVVIENIHRHIEDGQSPRTAALLGSREIGFTVMSISVSLIAAFIPLLFMGGVVGRLFSEFALTVTAAIVISVPASLTLGPMLASRFMKRARHTGAAKRQTFVDRLVGQYDRTLRWALAHQRFTLLVFAGAVAVAVGSYIAIPKGFFPLQDTAFVLGTTQAAQDITYEDMVAKHQALSEIIGNDDAVMGYSHAVGNTAGSQGMSNGRFWISLKNRSDRDVSVSEWIDRIRPKAAQIPGIVLFLRASQDVNLGSGGARTQYLYTLKSHDSALLSEWANRLTNKLLDLPQLRDLSNDLLLGASVARLEIDREAAARYGLTAKDINQVLYDAFGQRQISQYQTEINQYRVILEIDPAQRGSVESLQHFRLRSPSGQMVPLSAVAKVAPLSTGPLSISHAGMFPAVNISFNLAAGVALGDAVKLVEDAAAEIGLPAEISGRFQGAAQAFQDSLATQPMLILAALLTVYIILGMLYESFVHPLTILSTLPSAGIGAILALWAFGQDFSVMALIGIVLLIGIVKKNGILMVDFALQAQREQGLSPEAAVHQACLVRFRPIVMTTLAALLGAIPLTLGIGTGSELRQPLGIAVVGGLLVSQILTLYSTPVIFLALDRVFHASRRRKSDPRDAETSPEAGAAPTTGRATVQA